MVSHAETGLAVLEKPTWHETNPLGVRSIVLVGGATEDVATLNGLSDALGQEGFRVISYDQTTTPADVLASDSGYFPRYHAQKVEQLEEIIEEANHEGEKVTLLAHSHGAIFATEAALRHPDKVDRLILSNPAGLFEDTPPGLASRFLVETARKTVTPTKLAQKQQYHGTKGIISHPQSFIGDAVDTGHSDIRDNIRLLREAGVRVDALVSAKDQVFSDKRIEKGIGLGGQVLPEDIVVDGVHWYFTTRQNRRGKTKQHKFASKWAGHDQPIIYPAQTAKLVKQLIEG